MKSSGIKRVQWQDQAGFGLIEVMVTAVIIVLVATATVSSIGASTQQSARTLSRGVVANLAELDQERMRSFRAEDLVGLTETRTVDQENVTYTVDSKARFVTSDGEEVTCNSTGTQTRNLMLASTVTPPDSVRADSLTIRSLHPLPVSQFSPTSGTLVVRVYKADKATGQPNINVSLSGPESRSGITDDEGCIVFQFLKPGAYTGSIDQATFVDPALSQAITFSGTVTSGTINKATAIYYDRAGTIQPTYDHATSTTPANARGYSISHGNLSVPTTRTSATPSAAMGKMFPFPAPYTAYAGTCAANSPVTWEPTFYTAHPDFGQVTVPATVPASLVRVKLHEPVINVAITIKRAATNVGLANPKAQVWQTDTGCATTRWNPTYTITGSAATLGPFPLNSAKYPYGTYTICAEVEKTSGAGTNGVYSAAVSVQNKAFSGTPTTTVPIDTTNTSTTTSRRTCASR